MSAGTISFIVVILLAITHLGHATTIEWYRTAQGTSGRITNKANISFGGDFASEVTVTINRLALYTYCY